MAKAKKRKRKIQPTDTGADTGWKDYGTLIGFVLGVLGVGVIIWAGQQFGTPWLNHLTSLTGGLIGWVAGILLSPLDRREQLQFTAFGAAISAFTGGFLLAKADRLFDLTITKSADVTPVIFGGALLFVSSVMLGVLFTYIWRSYVPD